MKFLFTCGGTAGHINPALAVAGRLRQALPGSEFLFIGAQGRMETDLVPRAGYNIKTVKITNIHRSLRAPFGHVETHLRTQGLVVHGLLYDFRARDLAEDLEGAL